MRRSRSNTTSRRENERFMREDGVVYRCGEVYRTMVDKPPGMCSRELLRATMPACSTIRRDWRSWTGKKKKVSRFREAFLLKISETFCFCVARGGTSVVY